MASRKKKAESLSLGLSLPTPSISEATSLPDVAAVADSDRAVDLETFDDYDDAVQVEGVPRLRLVDPPREERVIVESIGGEFEVSRIRGTSCFARVMWTREELVELVSRATAALETSK